jgi:competence protein ComFC
VNCACAITRTLRVRPILRRVSGAKSRVLDLLFPRICIGCGGIGDYICVNCVAHLPLLDGPLCPHCGQPQASGILCPSCAGQTSSINSIRSAFRFEGVVRAAIHELKYRNLRAIAPTLATYLNACVLKTGTVADFIVPVPLHSKRQRRRGYNQAELLAHELGHAQGTPAVVSSLVRTGGEASQVHTGSMSDRRQNVARAFTCTDASFSGKRILLVDDVCTTGATLEACAVALRSAGAAEIYGLTVAREV